jgi:UDP-N-acetylmuramate dehydrogenase
MEFSYRHSVAEEGGMIIVSANMRFKEDDPAAISARVEELREKRNSKQPVNYPSAGSTFKRPVGGYAAALIEQSGLKGYRVGGAEVSEKHSGFVINRGGATCEDVLSVMRHVREKVLADSGILLEPEVRLINCAL